MVNHAGNHVVDHSDTAGTAPLNLPATVRRQSKLFCHPDPALPRMTHIRVLEIAFGLAIALVAYAGTAQAQGGFLTGNELLTYCKGGDSKNQAQCLGYIEGVVDTLAVSPFPLSCRLSGGVTVGQLKHVVVNALIADPTERTLPPSRWFAAQSPTPGFANHPSAGGDRNDNFPRVPAYALSPDRDLLVGALGDAEVVAPEFIYRQHSAAAPPRTPSLVPLP